MSVRIRDAAEADIPAVAEIERGCFSLPWSESMLRSQLAPGHLFLVAEQQGRVLGYVGLLFVLDEGYISNVAVAEAYRRRGVGDMLLDELYRRAAERKLAFLTLEVRESNTPARELYRKHGYRDVGLRKNYYEKPKENAVLMTLELP